MKRKALALILAVLMIVPAMAVIANAHNWAIASYLNDVTGATGTDKWTASAVNAGAAAFGIGPNSAVTSHDNANAAGWLPDAITVADCQYWVAGLLGSDYLGMQTVAPRTQIASNFKTALDDSGAEIYPLTYVNGATYGFENWGPTMISYAYSTDPIPAVSTGETDDNYGYIVYDPDNEDAPDIGSAAGLIQNGFVFTLTSEGVVANVNTDLGKLVQATKVVAAIYENGEIIAYSEAPVSNNQTLLTKLEEYASGSQAIFNGVSFDGSTLSFTIGDGWGWGINTYTFTVNDGNGWDNLARLSPYQDYYAGILVGSPLLVSDLDGHEDKDWAASSFVLKQFNDAYPKDAVGTGAPGGAAALADPLEDWVDANVSKSSLGIAGTEGQVNETTKGMRLFFTVNEDVVFDNVLTTASSAAEDFIGVSYPAATASATVSEIGILFGKDTRTLEEGAGAWRQNLTFESDFATIKSSKEFHGNLVKQTIFENGVQTGKLYKWANHQYYFSGMINNISSANLDSVYMMNVYAIVSVNGVPYKAYYANSSNRTFHNYYNRAVESGAWSTANSF